jgi:hypothetical protein
MNNQENKKIKPNDDDRDMDSDEFFNPQTFAQPNPPPFLSYFRPIPGVLPSIQPDSNLKKRIPRKSAPRLEKELAPTNLPAVPSKAQVLQRRSARLNKPVGGLLKFFIQRDARGGTITKSFDILIEENSLPEMLAIYHSVNGNNISKYRFWSNYIHNRGPYIDRYSNPYYLHRVEAPVNNLIATVTPRVDIHRPAIIPAQSVWLDQVRPVDIERVMRYLYDPKLHKTRVSTHLTLALPALGLNFDEGSITNLQTVGVRAPTILAQQLLHITQTYIRLLNFLPYNEEDDILYAIGFSFEGSMDFHRQQYQNYDLPKVAYQVNDRFRYHHYVGVYSGSAVDALEIIRQFTVRNSREILQLAISAQTLDVEPDVIAYVANVYRILLEEYGDEENVSMIISSMRFTIKPIRTKGPESIILVRTLTSDLEADQISSMAITSIVSANFNPEAARYHIPCFLKPFILTTSTLHGRNCANEIKAFKNESCRHAFIMDYLVYLQSLIEPGGSIPKLSSHVFHEHHAKLQTLATTSADEFFKVADNLFDLMSKVGWFIISNNFSTFNFPASHENLDRPIVIIFHQFNLASITGTTHHISDHIALSSQRLINDARIAITAIPNITRIWPIRADTDFLTGDVNYMTIPILRLFNHQEPFKKKPLLSLYWDIETYTTLSRPAYLACGVIPEVSKTFSYRGPNCIRDFLQGVIEWCESNNQQRLIMWSYNGAKFDNSYLLPFIREANLMGTAQDSKEIIIYAGNVTLTLYDFALTMGFGLRNTFISLGGKAELGKGVFDVFKINEENFEEIIEEAETYCIRDCNTLYRCVAMFRESLEKLDIKIPQGWVSAPALAFTIFSENYASRTPTECIKGLKRGIYEILQASYYGGYSQVYQKTLTNGFSYDINSSYPWAMCEPQPIWFDSIIYATDLNPINLYSDTSEAIYLYYLKSFKFDETVDSPPIPKRTPSGNIYARTGEDEWVWGHTLMFCLESYPGHFAIDMGAMITFKAGTPFKDFVGTFYKMKSETQDPCHRSFAKLMLNSLYGKFGQQEFGSTTLIDMREKTKLEALLTDKRRRVERVTPRQSADGGTILQITEYPVDVTPMHTGSGMQIASHIASLSRLKLFKMILSIQRRGGVVAYCDTDSVYCSIPLEEKDVHDTLMGAWKFETRIKRGRFFGSKNYVIETFEDKTIFHIKGIPKKYVTLDILDAIWNSSEGEVIAVTITELWKRTWGNVMSGEMIKNWRPTLNRRIFNEFTLSSKPLV